MWSNIVKCVTKETTINVKAKNSNLVSAKANSCFHVNSVHIPHTLNSLFAFISYIKYMVPINNTNKWKNSYSLTYLTYSTFIQKKYCCSRTVHFIIIIREDKVLGLPWDYFCGFSHSHMYFRKKESYVNRSIRRYGSIDVV